MEKNRLPYKSRGGRIFYFTDEEVNDQWKKQGRGSFVRVEESEIAIQKTIIESVHVYYPAWDKFLLYDGYGYIDYQYRTYGKQYGLRLDTIPLDIHKFALVHHSPQKVNEIKKHWDKPIVAYTMWETDKFPDPHFEAIKDTYAVIVPSEFVKNTLKKQGYKNKIYVCNQGVDTNHYQYFDRPQPETFRFLHNATGNPRKGWDYVIRAFTEEFKKDEKVRLTMKGIIKQKDNPQFIPFLKTPNVDWTDEVYDRKQTVEMYQNHHCLVFPTKGEGWGLVPHEAIMTGLPTITTRGHAIDDYWTFGMVEVATKLAPSKYVPEPLIKELKSEKPLDTWKNSGQWYEADIPDLKKQMREVYTNWTKYKKEAHMGSIYLSEEFSHIAMVKRLKNIVQEIYDSII